jgi:hypothetical protein
VIDLFRFLDWLIFLPQELQRDFSDEIERFEEERKMPYVTTIERMGIEKGLQKGMPQGMQQASETLVLRYLQHRFGELTEARTTAIHNLSLPQITALSEVLFDFTSLDEVDAWLQNQETLPLQA